MHIIEENENYIVVELLTSAGAKYCIGYPKSSGYKSETLISQLTEASLQPNEIDTNKIWRSLTWVPNATSTTSREAVVKGLTGGYVDKAKSFITYEYRINFANYDSQTYLFKDLTEDTYSCLTLRTGNHYIDYNSTNPTIIGVY